MTERSDPSPPPTKARDSEKARRLAAALRENLRRRKAQERGRDAQRDDAPRPETEEDR